MSFLAANPANFHHLSPRRVEQANKSLSTGNYGGELRPSSGGHVGSSRTAIAANFRSQFADENFALECLPLCTPSFARSPLRGFSDARRHSVFCFALRAPSGSRFLPKQVCKPGKRRRANFSRALPESRPSALGIRAHSLGSAQCDPTNNGKNQQQETRSCTRTK
jgi:hypothetical protein